MNHRVLVRSWLALALTACAPAATSPEPAASPEAAPAASAATPSTTPAAAAGPAVAVPAAIQAIVDAPDRDAADKALDEGRHPGEMLAYYGIEPGMKVAEVGAGSGYSTELLARAVGPTGVVYGENPKFVLEKFAEKPWSARLAKPVMKNVVRVDREFADPLPPEAHDLDAVFVVLFYHDTFWLNVDRAKMNAAIYKALKPGGIYAVLDHSGRTGTGSTEVKSLHRIEESVVTHEIEQAGFKLAGEGSFLRNPADTRDWNAAPFAAGDKRGQSDRFALKFVK